MPAPRTDDELLREALREPESEASRQAASELLSRYRRNVLRWCLQYTRRSDSALDLAQEVLIGAYRNLGGYQGRGTFGTWLFAITRNRCISELRRPSLAHDPDVDPDALPAEDESPGRKAMERISEEEILGILRQRLEPVEQDAVWLRYFEGMPVEMISEVLCLENASGARGILQRARRKLKPALLGRL
ncbi:MAG: sigma-70 family RNA polymerase sigma factor [Candidatus Eisenbacteria bacterium]|nr:sigma-70 family RNA polymerase sigma factor [Candidatus Eisenbacteria bacterium]